jgi:hypothetical protein
MKDIDLIKEFLLNIKIKTSLNNKDGRYNSTIDEDIIIKMLRDNGFGRDIFLTTDDLGLNNRHWFDIWLVNDNNPVNIKSSSFKSADNACNFLSLLYCFSDINIDKLHLANSGKDSILFSKLLKNGFVDNNRDYIFLVVNKNNGDVIVNSLKCLSTISINPNNLPFQINWRNNMNPIYRNIDELRSYYSNIFIKTREKDWRNRFYEGF